MRTFSLVVVIVSSLVACSESNIRPTISKNYTLGKEQIAYVGQAIVRVKHYDIGGPPVQTFASKIAFSGSMPDGTKVDYAAGTQADVAAMMDYDGDHFYILKLSPELPGNARLLVNLDGDYDAMAITEAGVMTEPCYTPGTACVEPKAMKFTPTKIDTTASASGNFEIVYSGATKDTVTLLYREYTPDDLARTAFSQNLTYDRASPTIRFRSLVIRVIEAGNESLRYVVEADGSAE